MAQRYALIDDEKHILKAGAPANAGGAVFGDQKFPVTAEGGQTQFQCSTISFTIDTLMVVLINGVEYEEGAGLDWVRDVPNQRINTNWTVPKNSRVTVRVF